MYFLMEFIQIKKRELLTKLISLDLDEGIRIEGPSEEKQIFVNRNACDNYVVQLVTHTKDSINNIKYFYSASDVLKFVKNTFDKNFSIWAY